MSKTVTISDVYILSHADYSDKLYQKQLSGNNNKWYSEENQNKN